MGLRLAVLGCPSFESVGGAQKGGGAKKEDGKQKGKGGTGQAGKVGDAEGEEATSAPACKLCPGLPADPTNTSCQCEPGYIFTNSRCVDIDECQNSPCPPTALCVNTIGAYQCQCPPGTVPDQFGRCQV